MFCFLCLYNTAALWEEQVRRERELHNRLHPEDPLEPVPVNNPIRNNTPTLTRPRGNTLNQGQMFGGLGMLGGSAMNLAGSMYASDQAAETARWTARYNNYGALLDRNKAKILVNNENYNHLKDFTDYSDAQYALKYHNITGKQVDTTKAYLPSPAKMRDEIRAKEFELDKTKADRQISIAKKFQANDQQYKLGLIKKSYAAQEQHQAVLNAQRLAQEKAFSGILGDRTWQLATGKERLAEKFGGFQTQQDLIRQKNRYAELKREASDSGIPVQALMLGGGVYHQPNAMMYSGGAGHMAYGGANMRALPAHANNSVSLANGWFTQ